MASHPPEGPALTIKQLAEAASFESWIDAALRDADYSKPWIHVSLPQMPCTIVQDELTRRYQSAGWSRLIFRMKATGPTVELQRLQTVQFGRKMA